MKPLDKSKVHKILFITLSNIGDVILSLPVFDILRADFPEADISVMVGPKAISLFQGNRHMKRLFIYDKHLSLFEKMVLMGRLFWQRYDLVVDLRNSAMPLFLWPRYRTSFVMRKNESQHMRDKHLAHLRKIYPFVNGARPHTAIDIGEADDVYAQNLLHKNVGTLPFVIFSPGAADPRKRWPMEYFAQLADSVMRSYHMRVIFVGDENDKVIADIIMRSMGELAVNLCGQLNLAQLAHVMKQAVMAVGNDTGPLHVASYLDRPVLALFGPTDPQRYGPWSANHLYVKSKEPCLACQKKSNTIKHKCMETLRPMDVLKTFLIMGREVRFKPSGVNN